MKPARATSNAEPALSQGFAAARTICGKAYPGITLPSAFLPRDKRDGVFSVLALCAMIRDASESQHDVSDQLRATLDELARGRLDLPLTEMRSLSQRALLAASQTCERYEVPVRCFLDYFEALRTRKPRYATWDSLRLYCDGTGGNLARAVSAVLGLTHSDGASRAAQLGAAIELTRILRQVRADLSRGRILLPLADLAHCRYSERDLSGSVVNQSLRDLVWLQADRAQAMFEASTEAIAWLEDDGSRLFASTIISTGLVVLRAMKARWEACLASPHDVSVLQMVRALPRAWRMSQKSPSP